MASPNEFIARSRTDSGSNHDGTKPRLPSFDYFVRSTGQTDIVRRSPDRVDTAFSSPSLWQSSLPTPPTTGSTSWLEDFQVKQEQERIYPFDRDPTHFQSDSRRRSSFVLPTPSHAWPRSARAYSSTERQFTEAHVLSWPHGQVTHEENVPGKGLCYVYDDGTLCPKEVDGNTVNPKWGTTKAGRPRKRLGQACNTCREKKIKCDPNYPKCSQCQRFNRECTFDANIRQARRSPNLRISTSSPGATTTCSPEQGISRRSSAAPTDTSTPVDNFINNHSNLSAASHETSTPIMAGRQTSDAPTPSKRPRISARLPDESIENNVSKSAHHKENSRYLEGYAADIDPMIANERLSMDYLQAFMDYVNVPTFELVPREHFLRWATDNRNKSMREKLVLYSFMALASVHSHQHNRNAHRRIFRQIVREKLDQLEAESYDLELAHITLLLAMADFVDDEHCKGYSIFVRAIACVTWLQMNLEKQQPSGITVYGFSSALYNECRRRTFWAAFACDTFGSFVKGDPRLLHKSDIYLKLPCASNLYNSGSIPNLPIFNQENALPRVLTTNEHLELGDMAYFLQITVIFSDVQLNAWHSRHKLMIGHQYPHDKCIREELESRLKTWADTYNQALRVKGGKTRAQDTSCNTLEVTFYPGKGAGLDLLYHYAAMELNRRIYHKNLTDAEIHQHAKQANMHAVEMLQLAQQVIASEGKETRDYIYVTRGLLAGFAVFTAIDILTAAGRLGDVLENRSKIMELMYAGLSLLEKTSDYWTSARIQHDMAKRRIQAVFITASTALNQRKLFFYCTDSMTPLLEKELDVIYGTDRKQYLRAAYAMNNVIKDSEIFEIDAKTIAATRPTT